MPFGCTRGKVSGSCLTPQVSAATQMNSRSLTQSQQRDFCVCFRPREENMELKKLLMTSGKEGVCRRPGSPKMEGAGKKGVAGQLQVCGQKLLPQHPARCSKVLVVRWLFLSLAWQSTSLELPPLSAYSAFSHMEHPFLATHTQAASQDRGSVAPTSPLFSRRNSSRSIAQRRWSSPWLSVSTLPEHIPLFTGWLLSVSLTSQTVLAS